MMIELSEPVLYALWRQAKDEGRALIVDERAVGHALAEMATESGEMKHCVLKPHGFGHVEIGFVA